MSWLKIDDRLFLHPKWLTTPPVARGLWITALSYCGAQNTDGLIPIPLLALLGGTEADAESLVASGLWHKEDAGYRVHDFADYNKTSDDRESLSEKRAAAGQAGGKQSQAKFKQSSSKVQATEKQNQAPEPEPVPVPVFCTNVQNNNPLPPDDVTGSLTDLAPVVVREGKVDLGIYVENILAEADHTPGREHWRKTVSDAMEQSATPVRSPRAFAKTMLDRWISNPSSAPPKHNPTAPVRSRAAPRQETPHQRAIRLDLEDSERELAEMRATLGITPRGDAVHEPMIDKLSLGGSLQ